MTRRPPPPYTPTAPPNGAPPPYEDIYTYNPTEELPPPRYNTISAAETQAPDVNDTRWEDGDCCQCFSGLVMTLLIFVLVAAIAAPSVYFHKVSLAAAERAAERAAKLAAEIAAGELLD